MTTLAVTSVSSLRCQASTCFRMGSKLRCIRSTPTEMQSMSENDFECFASTGETRLKQCFQIRVPRILDFLQADFWLGITTCPALSSGVLGGSFTVAEVTDSTSAKPTGGDNTIRVSGSLVLPKSVAPTSAAPAPRGTGRLDS